MDFEDFFDIGSIDIRLAEDQLEEEEARRVLDQISEPPAGCKSFFLITSEDYLSIGFLRFEIMEDSLIISSAYVDEMYRNNGIFKEMVTYAEELAAEYGSSFFSFLYPSNDEYTVIFESVSERLGFYDAESFEVESLEELDKLAKSDNPRKKLRRHKWVSNKAFSEYKSKPETQPEAAAAPAE